MPAHRELRSDIAWSTPDTITVRNHDLCRELLGHVSFGDMAFLQLTDRLPTPEQSVVFNALLVCLVEHGITPSAIATRMTYAGAPEAMQAAIAAGILGLGSVFVGSMEDAARVLQERLPEPQLAIDVEALAATIVDDLRARRQQIPGIGHQFHKPVDPRALRLFEIGRTQGISGPYVALMAAISRRAEEVLGKSLPVNATGAIAALGSELGLSWRIMRGIGVAARTIGLVGHIREEIDRPIALEIKRRTEHEATAHRFGPKD